MTYIPWYTVSVFIRKYPKKLRKVEIENEQILFLCQMWPTACSDSNRSLHLFCCFMSNNKSTVWLTVHKLHVLHPNAVKVEKVIII